MERVLRLGRVTFEVATGTPRAEAGLHGNGGDNCYLKLD